MKNSDARTQSLENMRALIAKSGGRNTTAIAPPKPLPPVSAEAIAGIFPKMPGRAAARAMSMASMREELAEHPVRREV